MSTIITASDAAGFNSAIAQANAASSGSVEIDLTGNITLNAELAAINLHSGVTLTINGNGTTLNGADTFRGLVIYSGTVAVENLEISHAIAKGGNAAGGNAFSGGGGAAGLGGGLLVADDVANGAAAAGNVTLVNVGFDHDQAVGGNGGAGDGNLDGTVSGGGGMGGNSFPVSADGGPGIGPNGFGNGGGANGGAHDNGGTGGFGGGGGASTYVANPGDGGVGGNGGFGGGGGGGDPQAVGQQAAGGVGGFGAGNGIGYSGGGGLAAGGDVFVEQGASLSITGSTMSNGSVTGGTGANNGQAYGAGVFMQGNGTIVLGAGSAAGQVTTIDAVIADETGSSGQNHGQGTVVVEGAGTVVLSAVNAFTSSAALINQATSGTLDVRVVNAVGSAVQFEGPATLRIENAALAGSNRSFGATIIGFSYADVIDLPGLAFAAGAQTQYNTSTHTLVVSSGGVSDTLSDVFAPVLPSFSAISDGTGGTEIVEALNGGAPGGTSADMVMRNSSTGQFEIYDVGQNAILGAAPLGYVELRSQQSQWQLAGLGSFNAADTADMMLRNTTTGALELYDVNNNNLTSAFSIGQVGLEWSVAGFGAFSSRPGETDMLMRNSNTGQFEIYDVSGNAIISAAPMGQVGLEWSVVGFGDFSTRSNETDMLMRNNNTGKFEIYDISNNQLTSAAPMGQVGLEWSVAGFGDFSGRANEADMLMRNNNTGQFEIYDISNSQLISAAPMGQVGLEWSVVGFGNFSGNANESDMLMRNKNTGAFEVYDITNNQLTFAAPMGQVGLEWQSAGIASNPTGGFAAADAQLTQAMASVVSSTDCTDVSTPVGSSVSMEMPTTTLLTTPQHT